MRAWLWIVVFSLPLGGCVKAPDPVLREPVPVAPRAYYRTVTLGQSVRGRPLVAHVLGSVGRTTFIFGGIHGDEPTSKQLTLRLLEYLRAHPEEYRGNRVVIMPAANPDGLAVGTRQNARGVDCNRNFPAGNWRNARPGSRYYGGARPMSEPETRAVAAVVRAFRPARIVSVHSISGGRFCNNYDGPARRLAELMALRNGYPVKPSIGYPTPGSFGSWAGVDRQIPTITLEMPANRPIDEVWAANRDALLAVIRQGRTRAAK